MESPWPASAAGSAVERLDRKVASVFYSGLEVPADITSGLGDPRVSDKVLAYALSFVQQYLKLGHAETAASVLEAYTRARADRQLPADRSAVTLRPQVLSALLKHLREQLNHTKDGRYTKVGADRAALSDRINSTERDLSVAREALQAVEPSTTPDELALCLHLT